MGNNESTEPFTTNMYNRRVLAGEFTIVNKYLLKDLVELGLWTPDVRNQIIADRGSVMNVSDIPTDIKVCCMISTSPRNSLYFQTLYILVTVCYG